jgi:hypothetical protein
MKSTPSVDDRPSPSSPATENPEANGVSIQDAGGYEATRFNALRHGLLSRYTVLPWERKGPYNSLVAALVAEYAPQGPTEEHLVEELAGVMWRKRRLRLAEAAVHRLALEDTFASYRDTAKAALVLLEPDCQEPDVAEAIRPTDDDIGQVETDEAAAGRALRALDADGETTYETARTALGKERRQWWDEALARDPKELDEGKKPYRADASGLRKFLEGEVLPWLARRRSALVNRPLIRRQAFGEAVNPRKLEPLARYEVHLDRKLERTVGMLLKLKDLRCEPEQSVSQNPIRRSCP